MREIATSAARLLPAVFGTCTNSQSGGGGSAAAATAFLSGDAFVDAPPAPRGGSGASVSTPPPSLGSAGLLASHPAVRLLPLDPAVAVAATRLPEPFHADPADRFLVAQARELRVPLLSADSKIRSYGHVRSLW